MKKQSPVFKDKNGKLTPYAFECGYIEDITINGINIQLWKYAGCIGYHIRVHDRNIGKRISWETRKYLRHAYNLFENKVKQYS